MVVTADKMMCKHFSRLVQSSKTSFPGCFSILELHE